MLRDYKRFIKIAENGDKIQTEYETMEIKEIMEQEWEWGVVCGNIGYKDYWNITFRDTNGKTRNWNSVYDGGKLIDKNE